MCRCLIWLMACRREFREWSDEVNLSGGAGGPLMVALITQTIENEQPPEAAGRCARSCRDRAEVVPKIFSCILEG